MVSREENLLPGLNFRQKLSMQYRRLWHRWSRKCKYPEYEWEKVTLQVTLQARLSPPPCVAPVLRHGDMRGTNLAKGSLTNRHHILCQKMKLLKLELRPNSSGLLFFRERCEHALQADS